jgi:hypothetical protein
MCRSGCAGSCQRFAACLQRTRGSTTEPCCGSDARYRHAVAAARVRWSKSPPPTPPPPLRRRPRRLGRPLPPPLRQHHQQEQQRPPSPMRLARVHHARRSCHWMRQRVRWSWAAASRPDGESARCRSCGGLVTAPRAARAAGRGRRRALPLLARTSRRLFAAGLPSRRCRTARSVSRVTCVRGACAYARSVHEECPGAPAPHAGCSFCDRDPAEGGPYCAVGWRVDKAVAADLHFSVHFAPSERGAALDGGALLRAVDDGLMDGWGGQYLIMIGCRSRRCQRMQVMDGVSTTSFEWRHAEGSVLPAEQLLHTADVQAWIRWVRRLSCRRRRRRRRRALHACDCG